MNHGSFLSETESGRDGQHNGHRLDQEGPLAQVTSDDEPAEDRLDLWDAGAAGVGGEHADQTGSQGGQAQCPEYVEEVGEDVGARPVLLVTHHFRPGKPANLIKKKRFLDHFLAFQVFKITVKKYVFDGFSF